MVEIIKTATLFILLAATMLINQQDNLLARLGMSGNYAALAAFALVATLLLSGRTVHIIAVSVTLCLLANMPMDFGLNMGLDRDLYGGLFLAILLQPIVNRLAIV